MIISGNLFNSYLAPFLVIHATIDGRGGVEKSETESVRSPVRNYEMMTDLFCCMNVGKVSFNYRDGYTSDRIANHIKVMIKAALNKKRPSSILPLLTRRFKTGSVSSLLICALFVFTGVKVDKLGKNKSENLEDCHALM